MKALITQSQQDDRPDFFPSGGIYRYVDSVLTQETNDESNGGFNLAETVESKLDIRSMKPKRKDGDAYEVNPQKNKKRTIYVIKDIDRDEYLSLNEEEFFIWSMLDGNRSVEEICQQYFLKYKKLSDMPIKLILKVEKKNMLSNQWWDIYQTVYYTQSKGLRRALKTIMSCFLRFKISVKGADGFFNFLYKSVGRFLLSKEMVALYLVLIAAGLFVFLGMGYYSQRYSLKNFITHQFSMLIIAIFSILPVVFHEFAHGMMCKKYGRKVNKAGLMLYIGLPMMFVETTDIWLRPKKERIYVSLAGPFTDLLVGSSCFLVHKIAGNTGLLQLLPIVGLIAYFRCLFNFNPLLEFDGYYILMDLLEIPELRAKSFRFVSQGGVKKLVKKEKLKRDEYIFLIYGLIAGVYTYGMIIFMLNMWQTKIRNILMEIIYNEHHSFISLLLIIMAGGFVIIRLLFMVKLLFKKIKPVISRLYRMIYSSFKKLDILNKGGHNGGAK
jgi:putative peptide zinc metalloprotease protein